MGLLATLSTVAAPARMQAMTSGQYNQAFWSGDPVPEPWLGPGYGYVTPDVALALTYVYSAVDIISSDLGTMTCQMFETLGDDGRRRVKVGEAGVGSLAQKLRWAPNNFQTAKAFWSTLAWQYLLRPACYAEIIYRPGLNGFVEQIIPRHPDRVTQEVLANGRIRFKLREPDGTHRIVTQDEMFVVRNTSMDGLNGLARIEYGSAAIAAGLALQNYTKAFFQKGASAALLATYKGALEGPDEEALHASIARFMGTDNAGGVMLVPEDIDVKALGVDPEKAELVGLKNISGRDIARLFKMPPSWLGIEGAQSYNSLIQDSQLYVNRVLAPLVVEFEQAIQRDLIVAKHRFFAKFNMDYLLRGDFLQRMQGYEIGIRSRVIRPSEARVREDLNPDAALDKLSERDNQPGQAGVGSGGSTNRPREANSRALEQALELSASMATDAQAARVESSSAKEELTTARVELAKLNELLSTALSTASLSAEARDAAILERDVATSRVAALTERASDSESRAVRAEADAESARALAADRDRLAAMLAAEHGKAAQMSLVCLRSVMIIHDRATALIARERREIARLATKHAADLAAWRRSLERFHVEHTHAITRELHIHVDSARAFLNRHWQDLMAQGLGLMDGAAGDRWARDESERLAAMALDGEREEAA